MGLQEREQRQARGRPGGPQCAWQLQLGGRGRLPRGSLCRGRGRLPDSGEAGRGLTSVTSVTDVHRQTWRDSVYSDFSSRRNIKEKVKQINQLLRLAKEHPLFS